MSFNFSKTRGGVGSNMMQSYVENRLQGLHDTSRASVSNYKDKVISFFVGALTIILLPYIHLGKSSPDKTTLVNVYVDLVVFTRIAGTS